MTLKQIPHFICAFLLGFPALAATGVGVTYHGRLVGPDGTPVSSSSVQFRLQIKTPGSENCLMYEEIQNKDMSSSSGVFAVTINDGTGARQDASTFSLDQIFANRSNFNFPAGYCASGTSYLPNASDGRQFQVFFNDGSFTGWEPVPAQAINFVPMAIESMQVGGYKKENLVKVATGVDTTGFDLSAANFTELMALVTGTSTQFVKPSAATFTAAPQWSGTPTGASDLANKSYVDAQVAAGLPNFGTAGTYTKVTTDAKGRVSSGTTLAAADIPALDASKITSGVLPIANGGTNSSTALTGSKVMVSSATSIVEGMASNTAKSNNTFVMRDGTGNIAGALGTFDGLSVLLGGSIGLNGATSGTVSLAAPTAVTSYTMTLPATAGTTGQVLTTNGTGILSWSTASSGLPAAAGTAAAPGYAFSGNTNTGMFGAAVNQIGFSTNGSESVRIDASGNVGVGIAAPASKLHITGAAAGAAFSGLMIANTPGGIGSSADLRFALGNDGSGGLTGAIQNYSDTAAQAGLAFSTYSGAPTEKMRITGTGNVGIGTLTPGSKLDVSGTTTTTNLLMTTGTIGWSTQVAGLKENWGLELLADTSHPIQVPGGSLLVGYDQVDATARGVGNLMVSGNVGVGTLTPGAALDVKGTGGLRLEGATSGYAGLQSSAVGPSVTWTLPTADGTGFLKSDGAGNLSFATPTAAAGGSAGQVQFNSAGALAGSSNFFWDNTNSRLGIGTASPSAALTVAGGTGFMKVTPGWNSSAGTWIDLDTTGPSGIGSGGAGANAWIGYVSTAGNWFTGSAIGDVVYRNAFGKKIHVGIDNGSGSANPSMTFSGTNVGIGNTAPAASLDVVSPTGVYGLQLKTATTTEGYMKMVNSSGVTAFDFASVASAGAQPRLRMYDSGSTERFGVYSVANAGPHVYSNANDTNAADGTTTTGGLGMLIAVPSVLNQENGIFFTNSPSLSAIGAGITYYVSDTTSYGRGGLHLKTSAAGNPTTRMTIDSSGNVGIGTTNPTNPLNIKANGNQIKIEDGAAGGWVVDVNNITPNFLITRSYGNGSFQVNTGGGVKLHVESLTGNVGIGTTAPSGKLEVSGAINATNNPDTKYALRVNNSMSSGGWGNYTAIAVESAPTFDGGGAVSGQYYGIRSAPVLNNGAGNTMYGVYSNPSGAAGTIYSGVFMGGNVGVGTASPAQKLEVNGGVRINTATAKPTCDSTTRGTFWFTQSGAGVKDSVEVCAKDAADAYAWRTIY